jgi:hypothetical protein
MAGLVLRSVLSDMKDNIGTVDAALHREADESIREGMQAYEYILRAEQSESEKIASETILNF